MMYMTVTMRDPEIDMFNDLYDDMDHDFVYDLD